jgi:hypothetical protein
MFLTIGGLGGRCDGAATTECDVPPGERFTLRMELDSPPEGGYVAFQTLAILDEGLDYAQTSIAAVEIVWPDASGFALRDVGSRISHGALSAQTPPFPVSHYSGPLVQLDIGCDALGSHDIVLLAFSVSNTLGSGIRVPDPQPDGTMILPARGIDTATILGRLEVVADRLTVNCVAP